MYKITCSRDILCRNKAIVISNIKECLFIRIAKSRLIMDSEDKLDISRWIVKVEKEGLKMFAASTEEVLEQIR